MGLKKASVALIAFAACAAIAFPAGDRTLTVTAVANDVFPLAAGGPTKMPFETSYQHRVVAFHSSAGRSRRGLGR